MLDALSLHAGTLAALAACGLLAYLFLPARSRLGDVARAQMTVFCVHCNWEGRVKRSGGCCRRCRSTNLSVISV